MLTPNCYLYYLLTADVSQRTLIVWEGSLYSCSSKTRLDLTEKGKLLFFICSEAVESKLVKLETSRTVIFPQRCVSLFVPLKLSFVKLFVPITTSFHFKTNFSYLQD